MSEMIELAKRLRSLSNFDTIPFDAVIDLNEAAMWLIRMERIDRHKTRLIERYRNQLAELKEQEVTGGY